MRRLALTFIALIFALTTVPSAHAAAVTVTVRGGWVNDLPAAYCNPTKATTGPGLPPTRVTLHCLAGAAFNGSFMGHGIATTVQTVDTGPPVNTATPSVSGSFDEWFYGMYWADGSIGGLHFRGTFSISSKDGTFFATATIVGGTCDFAGATGSLTFNGYSTNGGYSGSLTLPAPPDGFTPSTSPCVVPPAIP